MKPLELLKEHCKFENDYQVYVLLAVSRKKDTPEITNSQEIVFREVVKNETDIIRKYNKIKAQITNYKDEEGKSFPFYLYISCNPRNSRKATFILISQINNWFQEELNGVDNSRMFKKIYGHFYSALMKIEARDKKSSFMIDYDKKENVKTFIEKLKLIDVEIELQQETRNGYHFKVKPFNVNKLFDVGLHKLEIYPLDIKKDGNLFVEYVQHLPEAKIKNDKFKKEVSENLYF